ncbi:MAG: FixH family protein [Terriglobales bacterium]
MIRRISLLLVLALPLVAQQRIQAIGTPTATVRYQNLNDTVTTVASVAIDTATITVVSARFDGWVEQVQAATPFQRVRRGEVLCTIYSPDIYAAEQDYLFAVRNQTTLAPSPIPGVASGAASLVGDARQRLEQLLVPQPEIARLERTHRAKKFFAITAPETGVISNRKAFPGVRVNAGVPLYRLEALHPIWVNALVEESDLGRVRAGQTATVRLDAYPGQSFRAQVALVEPQVEPASRTARVRLILPNADLALSPGMFGQATIDVPLGRRLVVPASAVLESGTGAMAFVSLGGGQFNPRPVQPGPQIGDQMVILKGLHAGERVATGANFLIASEAQLSAAAGSYAPPPPGVSAHATPLSSAPNGHAALTTSPSPARKGKNTFRVYLTTASGAPITGATVSVTLAMPAMPAMGMAGMNVTVPLQPQGGGHYSGTGALGSGGNWQVTVLARKHGNVVVRVRTSLRVQGGM